MISGFGKFCVKNKRNVKAEIRLLVRIPGSVQKKELYDLRGAAKRP